MMRKILPVCIILLAAGSLGARSEARKYELIGKILQSDGKPFRGVAPVVFLHGSVTPFTTQTQAGPDGQFKFKNLPAGSYTVVAAVPRAGELQRTIEVGPSFADPKGRVLTTLLLDPASSRKKIHAVSAVELSIPEGAKREYERGRSYLAKRDTEHAIAYFKKAIEIAPQFTLAWNSLGVIAYQSRQFAQAEEYFREGLKQDPEAYSPLVNLGGALLSQGKDKESLPINQQAVKARPDDSLAHSQLGQSYFFLGQLDDAERHLKQAKALDAAHFSYPQLVLAQIYARRQNIPAMVKELEDFLRQHPDSKIAPEVRKSLEKARAFLSAPSKSNRPDPNH